MDQKEFENIFNNYKTRIFNFNLRILGNVANAEDCTQDTFIKVAKSYESLKDKSKLKSWIYTIAKNTALDYIKRRKYEANMPTVINPDTGEQEELEVADIDQKKIPDKKYQTKEYRELVWQATKDIKPEYREVLILKDIQELNYQEISDIMGKTKNNIEVLVHRARQKFKEQYIKKITERKAISNKCQEIGPMLSAFIDQELDLNKVKTIESHLESCQYCQESKSTLLDLKHAFAAVPIFAVTQGLNLKLANVLSTIADKGVAALKTITTTGLIAGIIVKTKSFIIAHKIIATILATTIVAGPIGGYIAYNHLKPNPELLKGIAIQSTAWNGSYWLISGADSDKKPKLFKYNGTRFTDLSSNLDKSNGPINNLASNDAYWLISCYKNPDNLNLPSKPSLLKYNSTTFTDLTSNVGLQNCHINSMVWNGSYWLIGVSFPSSKPEDIKNHSVLYKYNGTTFTDLNLNNEMSNMAGVNSITWNGSYWLISGYGSKALYRYDGTKFDAISINGQDGYQVQAMAWNGSYYLMSGDFTFLEKRTLSNGREGEYGTILNFFYKYDGATFTALSSYLGGDSNYRVMSVISNGSYWLIGGTFTTKDMDRRPVSGFLYKYDGNQFVDLSPNISGIDKYFCGFVNSIAWNGSYWLISSGTELYKYKDDQFIKLTK